MEKTLKLDPGGRFAIDTDLGSVTVTGTSSPDARLVVTSKRRDLDELLRFTFQEDSGLRERHGATEGRSHLSVARPPRVSVHCEIKVPARTMLDIDTSGGAIQISAMRSEARLQTSGGRIVVRDLVGDLDGRTSGGGIDLERIRGRVDVETSGGGIEATEIDGPIEADTSGGGVRLDRVSGDIRAHSSGGGIHIFEAGGRVVADTSGGGIEASFARGNDRGGSLETSGGGIQVELDPSVGLQIDASGTSVRADLPLTVKGTNSRRRLQGTLGRGGELLKMHTSGGGVRINALIAARKKGTDSFTRQQNRLCLPRRKINLSPLSRIGSWNPSRSSAPVRRESPARSSSSNRGIAAICYDRGHILQSIYDFPEEMRWFSTRDLLDIAGVPFTVPDAHPTRLETLAYYRGRRRAIRGARRPRDGGRSMAPIPAGGLEVARRRIGRAPPDLRAGRGSRDGFLRHPEEARRAGRRAAPRPPRATSRATPSTAATSWSSGGKNSASEAALDLYRHGARVTLLVRAPRRSRSG